MAMALGYFRQERVRLTNSGYVYLRHHYNDVTVSAMASQFTSLMAVYSTVFQAQMTENIKDSRHWPLWGEFFGDRWIPHTKGQWRGKCFRSDDAIMINVFLFAKIAHYDLCTMMWYLLFCNGLHSVIQWQSDLILTTSLRKLKSITLQCYLECRTEWLMEQSVCTSRHNSPLWKRYGSDTLHIDKIGLVLTCTKAPGH